MESIVDFKVLLQDNEDALITWRPLRTELAHTFTLSRSSDGVTWTPVATFANDYSLPQWDASSKRWSVTDAGGSEGDLYRLHVTDTYTETTEYGAYPALLQTATIFGYLYALDGRASVLTQAQRVVKAELIGPPLHSSATLRGRIKPNVGMASRTLETVADDAGFWKMTIAQGSRVLFSIPALDFVRLTEVPREAGLFNVMDLAVLEDYPRPAYHRGQKRK